MAARCRSVNWSRRRISRACNCGPMVSTRRPKSIGTRRRCTGHPFYYFAYGAAVSEVVVDTLTGEWKLVRADLLHDAGQSINPAIDIGQVEGGFIQGMGWLTTEELWWNRDGRLMTHAPSTYKIPAVSDTPAAFNVALYRNDNVEPTVFRSKAVGEPPLLLGFSVLLAIRAAIASAAPDANDAPQLRAPATPEAILDALDACAAAASGQPAQAGEPSQPSTNDAASTGPGELAPEHQLIRSASDASLAARPATTARARRCPRARDGRARRRLRTARSPARR